MPTGTLEIDSFFSVLDAYGIQKLLRRIAGVGRVSVNPVSGSTTVMYDPEKTNLPGNSGRHQELWLHCKGEAVPRHIRPDVHRVQSGDVRRTGDRLLLSPILTY